jgi:hypothetical protein
MSWLRLFCLASCFLMVVSVAMAAKGTGHGNKHGKPPPPPPANGFLLLVGGGKVLLVGGGDLLCVGTC